MTCPHFKASLSWVCPNIRSMASWVCHLWTPSNSRGKTDMSSSWQCTQIGKHEIWWRPRYTKQKFPGWGSQKTAEKTRYASDCQKACCHTSQQQYITIPFSKIQDTSSIFRWILISAHFRSAYCKPCQNTTPFFVAACSRENLSVCG